MTNTPVFVRFLDPEHQIQLISALLRIGERKFRQRENRSIEELGYKLLILCRNLNARYRNNRV